MTRSLELGLETFGDVTRDAAGALLGHPEVLRQVVEQAVLADQVGVDFFGVGEHHRPDFAISSPETLLAAIAARTSRIRLGSAVTVLSSDDPVRVFERFSTLNAVSNGRAEVVLGRGSFTESFPLFGYPLDQYELLFEERLELFSRILESDRTGTPFSWQGRTRAALVNQRVHPTAGPGGLRVWIGVGGSPESVVRAARYRLPMILAIIGGDPRRFLPYAELYRRTLAEHGADPLPIGIHSHGHVADTDARARAEMFEPWREMRDRIGAERGWPPTGRDDFEREAASGSVYVGSPETVARRIAATVRALGASRFDIKYSAGTLAHEKMMRAIELFGREVAPRVREMLEVSTGEAL